MRFSQDSALVNKMIDTHCHLNDEQLYPERKEVVERALSSGVTRMLVVGWDLDSSKRAVQLADEFDSVYAAVGFHPENLDDISDDALKEIEQLAKHPKVVAIGEIGLDYHWFKEEEHRAKQKVWFLKQIELANKLNLPVSIHAREATEDTYNILVDHPINKKCVLHCYSGSPEMAERFTKLGIYFGFDGPITYKNAEGPRKCVSTITIDRLLTETDCPYLTPIPYRGKRNEPSFIPLILEKMAELRGFSVGEMEEIIDRNAKEIYGI